MATEFSHEANQSPATAERRAEILANPGFGDYFSDHMVTIDWEGDYKTGGTWYDARVHPYGPLVLDPQHPSSTTARKSSKASRATATPTAPRATHTH